MPRIRSIKPEFADSQSLGRVSRDARLLYVLLMTHADDAGRLRAHPRYLAHTLFPYDSDAEGKIGKWLHELESERQVQTYRYEGQDYVALSNWLSEQKIDKPHESRLPSPPRLGQVEMPFDLAGEATSDTISEIAAARSRRRDNN